MGLEHFMAGKLRPVGISHRRSISRRAALCSGVSVPGLTTLLISLALPYLIAFLLDVEVVR